MRFGGKERLKDPVGNFLAQAHSRILNFDDDFTSGFLAGRDPKLLDTARRTVHRIDAIGYQILQHLLQLHPVTFHLGQIQCEIRVVE